MTTGSESPKARRVRGRPKWFKAKHLVDPVLSYKDFVPLVGKVLPSAYGAEQVRGVIDCLVYSIVEAISRGETAEFGNFCKIEHLPIPNLMPGYKVMTITPRVTFLQEKMPKEETLVELDGPPTESVETVLTFTELARRVSTRAGLPKDLSQDLVRSFFRLIRAEMAHSVVLIEGLGAFFTQRIFRTIKPPPLARKPPYKGWIVSPKFQASPQFLRSYKSGLMFPRRYRPPSYWSRRKARAEAAAKA